jgi:acid phosphatase
MQGMWRVVIASVLVIAGCSSAARTSASSHPPTPAQPSSVRPSTTHPMTQPMTSSPSRSPSPSPSSSVDALALFRPAHVVIVMEENKGYSEVLSGTSAPYIQSLARNGALLTAYYAVTHPSYPNYLALFSGSTQGVTNDDCPRSFGGGNLGHSLLLAHRTFVGYSESLPYAGSTICTTSSGYARRHSPWVSFTDLPKSVNQPFTSFPTDYTRLPTLSFVIPNVNHDMHDGTIAQGDSWLHSKLGAYATWARTHGSLLVVLFDESEASGDNRVPAIVYGADVKVGRYGTHLTHYSALRLFEDMYALPRLGHSATAPVFPDIWR